MSSYSWINISLAIGALYIVFLLWRWHVDKHNRYDVRDLLMDEGKASLSKHILAGMALLSAWVVVDRELDGRDDVSTILLGVLGIFVAQRAVGNITQAMTTRSKEE